MKTLLRFFIGFCVSFGMSVVLWELILLVLYKMGNLAHSYIVRNFIIFFVGVFFSIGYTGFVYYMAHDSLKTTRYKNTVFISLVFYMLLFLIRAVFFRYDLSFSYRLIFFTAGGLAAAFFWLLSKPERNTNKLTDRELRSYNRYRR